MSGLVPGATVEVEVRIAGTVQTIRQVASLSAQIDLPKAFQLVADTARARQRLGALTSAWDRGSVSPDNHAMEVSSGFPNGLPVPALFNELFYDCGIAVGVKSFVTGAKVWATAHPSNGAPFQIFEKDRVAWPTASGVTMAFHRTDELQAHYAFCGQEVHSSPIRAFKVSSLPAMPNGPPVPTVDAPLEGTDIVHIHQLMHGARVHAMDQNKVELGSGASVSEGIGLRARRTFVAGEQILAWQEFGGCGVRSKAGPAASVMACSALKAPRVARPTPGDQEIRVLESHPDAAILVYDSTTTLIGYGVAPRVPIARPLVGSEVLMVLQEVGSCTSSTTLRIFVDCSPKGEVELLNAFPERRRRLGLTQLTANQCR